MVRRSWGRKPWLLASLCWFSLTVLVHLFAAYFSLHYRLNQFLWLLFGTSESVYGFRNLIFPRLIIATIISIPPAVIGIAVYERRVAWQRMFLAWMCWSGSFLVMWL